jgi:hypothetical protein
MSTVATTRQIIIDINPLWMMNINNSPSYDEVSLESLTSYTGASFEKKRNGPIMFPIQYAMNIIALMVAFLVNPATLDDTIDRVIGIPAA